MPPKPPAIELIGLTKVYAGRQPAVDRLSLSIPAGSFFGFLGPNGAGKSTTIGCLTGLLDPTSGSVRLLGRPFNSDSVGLKRRIGVMPEGLSLFDHLYADEFLLFIGRMFGLRDDVSRSRIDELLEALDLLEARRQRLVSYSTGMRKKVAFAAAVLHRPEILFLDEPFDNIDPSAVSMLKDWLRAYTSNGGTVFLTTHVLETVEKLCDTAAIIQAGRLVWRGSLAPLGSGGGLVHDGQPFPTLESLFLHLIGERQRPLSWL